MRLALCTNQCRIPQLNLTRILMPRGMYAILLPPRCVSFVLHQCSHPKIGNYFQSTSAWVGNHPIIIVPVVQAWKTFSSGKTSLKSWLRESASGPPTSTRSVSVLVRRASKQTVARTNHRESHLGCTLQPIRIKYEVVTHVPPVGWQSLAKYGRTFYKPILLIFGYNLLSFLQMALF